MDSDRVFSLPLMQGPRVPTHLSVSGLTTMAPANTVAAVPVGKERTTKSVPLTPMAATGVFKRKRSLAASPHEPVMERMTPSSKRNLMAES